MNDKWDADKGREINEINVMRFYVHALSHLN